MPRRHHLPVVAVAVLVAGCTTYESAYERHVYDEEPVYCYQSLAGVDCYRAPYARDADRLVNYYGPAPSKYEPPEPPEESELGEPPEGGDFDRDPEPAPGPAKLGAGTPPRTDADRPTAPQSRAGGPEEGDDDWRSWLPVLSAVFGALQVMAVFVF